MTDSEITIDAEAWQSLAARNGCTFLGHQRFEDENLYAQFTDLKTGSTFTKDIGETIVMALEKVRRKWGNAACA